MMPDLFEGMAVDYGRPVVSLARARELVEDVEELAFEVTGFYDSCERVHEMARKMGAHSVARVVLWLGIPSTLDRYGYDAMHIRAERCARRWLARLEAGRAQ